MEKEQVQQPGPIEPPGPQEVHHQAEAGAEPLMGQVQAMVQQLAENQQAMWQHMQSMHQSMQAQAPQPQGAAAPGATGCATAPPMDTHRSGPPPQAEACEHHIHDPQQQVEHFMNMAQKFSNGDVSMTDVAGGLSYLNTQSSAFWKGLIIGGGLTFVLSSESIRSALGGMFKGKESA